MQVFSVFLFVYMLFFYYLCPRFWSLEIDYALQPASCRAPPVLPIPSLSSRATWASLSS